MYNYKNIEIIEKKTAKKQIKAAISAFSFFIIIWKEVFDVAIFELNLPGGCQPLTN